MRRRIFVTVGCVSGYNSGTGGLYYSLKETVFALSHKYDITVCVMGNKYPQALMDMSSSIIEIDTDKYTTTEVTRLVYTLLRNGGFHLVHAYDRTTARLVSIAALANGIPLVYTKCGGAINRSNISFVDRIITYSKRDFESLSIQESSRDNKVFWIPNQVGVINNIDERIDLLRNDLMTYKCISGNTKLLMRVGRISEYYRLTLMQGIELVKWLRTKGRDVCMVVVGTIESERLAQDIKEEGGGSAIIISDVKYTLNARHLMSLADIILGTGRSLMEGLNANGIVLCPVKGARYPALVTPGNIGDLAIDNFSERSCVNDYSEESNLENVCRTLWDNNYRHELLDFYHNVFDKEYSIYRAVDRLEKIYEDVISVRMTKLEFIRHAMVNISSYLRLLLGERYRAVL